MNEQEHLSLIEARCEALLEGAKMRTPEKWSESPNKRAVYCACYQVAYTGESNGNAAFIASCAGPAEAGWKSTIAACKRLCGLTSRLWTAGDMQEAQVIIAAWPVELL